MVDMVMLDTIGFSGFSYEFRALANASIYGSINTEGFFPAPS